jgi:hypothetical protein
MGEETHQRRFLESLRITFKLQKNSEIKIKKYNFASNDILTKYLELGLK